MNPEKSAPEKKLMRWLLLATIALLLLVLGLQLWQIFGGKPAAQPQDAPAVQDAPVTQDAGAPADIPGVSPGKAAMIEDVRTLNSALSAEDLAALSVEELEQLWKTGAPGLPIGLAAAALAAEEYAGTLEMDSVTWKADPELDDSPAHYEVELRHITLGDFEYKVDAYTGEILEGRANLFANVPEAGTADGGDAPAAGKGEPKTGSGETVPPAGTSSDAKKPSDPKTPAAQTGAVDEEGAKAAAFAHAGVSAADVTGLKVESDWDDGVRIYEIEFRANGAEYDYEIDAATGAVRKAEQKWGPSGGSGASGPIGEEAAKAAALAHAGVSAQDVDYIRWELDQDDGVQVYEIEFAVGRVEYEYKIEASTGAVLKAERDAD